VRRSTATERTSSALMKLFIARPASGGSTGTWRRIPLGAGCHRQYDGQCGWTMVERFDRDHQRGSDTGLFVPARAVQVEHPYLAARRECRGHSSFDRSDSVTATVVPPGSFASAIHRYKVGPPCQGRAPVHQTPQKISRLIYLSVSRNARSHHNWNFTWRVSPSHNSSSSDSGGRVW
jgi:hypothetical protein